VVDRTKVDQKTLQAAEGMEAMFLDYMLKVMRETVPKSDMDLENQATGIYRGMMDSEVAQKAARAGGVGLADQIVAYLESQRYTDPRARMAPPTGQGMVPAGYPSPQRSGGVSNDPTIENDRQTGGTHEGQSIRK
jgi:flagellar protein FlgJ